MDHVKLRKQNSSSQETGPWCFFTTGELLLLTLPPFHSRQALPILTCSKPSFPELLFIILCEYSTQKPPYAQQASAATPFLLSLEVTKPQPSLGSSLSCSFHPMCSDLNVSWLTPSYNLHLSSASLVRDAFS